MYLQNKQIYIIYTHLDTNILTDCSELWLITIGGYEKHERYNGVFSTGL